MSDGKRKPLRWKSHAMDASKTVQFRILEHGFNPTSLSLPVDGFTSPLRRAAPPPAAPAPATPAFELPDLSSFPTAEEKAVRLLQAAAEIEHSLMVQYLYAGYGFTVPNRTILNIAVEEMSHLMTVQNLLMLIGAGPELGRQDFGPPSSEDERLFPFDLLLEPVTNVSLAKYVVAESPRDVPAGVDPALMQRIVDLATHNAGTPINRVGTLYGLLGAVFGSEQLLLTQAATGDDWYVMVNALAEEAAAAYGGRDKLHLPDSAFHPNSVDSQGPDSEWDRSEPSPSLDDFRVHVVDGRESALNALRDIGLQGEGPSAEATEEAHFVRFLNLFKLFFGPDGAGTGSAQGVAPVPNAARIVVDETSAEAEAISHPLTVRWATLADARYAILLGSLEFYLRLPASERGFLIGWCFAEMAALKILSGFLTTMPRTSTSAPVVAALPFNQPPWAGGPAGWQDLESAYNAAAAEITALGTAAGTSEDQKRLLLHLSTSDARKLDEVRARIGGGTARRKYDRAREILDWAAGAGTPRHNGDSPSLPAQNQGRFWNQSLDDFKATSIFDENIVATPPGGGDPLIIDQIRTGSMPRKRPPLPEDGEEFLFLEQWVKDGCPDDPV